MPKPLDWSLQMTTSKLTLTKPLVSSRNLFKFVQSAKKIFASGAHVLFFVLSKKNLINHFIHRTSLHRTPNLPYSTSLDSPPTAGSIASSPCSVQSTSILEQEIPQRSRTQLRKEHRNAERKQKLQRAKNHRQHTNNRKLKHVRGFEPTVASTTVATRVDTDFSDSPHSGPGFIGLSLKTHPSIPVPPTAPAYSQLPNQVSEADLDPDCDQGVKNLVQKGWTYIRNEIEQVTQAQTVRPRTDLWAFPA